MALDSQEQVKNGIRYLGSSDHVCGFPTTPVAHSKSWTGACFSFACFSFACFSFAFFAYLRMSFEVTTGRVTPRRIQSRM
jgi:hypothetical protein